MSHALVETSVDTATVVVPNPGENVTGASVEVPFQALANRTRFHRDEFARIDDLVRAQGVQNWQLCAASVSNLNSDPVVAWVPTSAAEDGYWVAVAGHAANTAAVGLTEDECGMQDVALPNWPVAVSSITWMAVATWDAGLGCAPFIVGGAQGDIAVQRGALPAAADYGTAVVSGVATETTCGVWSPAASKFVVGSSDGAVPAIYLVTTADPPVSAAVAGLTVDVSTTVTCMAIDTANDIVLAFGNGVGGVADSWRITAAGTTVALYTQDVGGGVDSSPAALAYSATSELWMLITTGAAWAVYTSPDAITWTEVATEVPGLDDATGLVEVDGLWVAGCAGYVMFSVDDGVTWHRCTLNGAAGTASPNVLTGLDIRVAYSPGRRRFAAVHREAGNALVMNRSLTIGLMPEHS